MTLTLEGYLALRHCSRDLGMEQQFCQMPLQDAPLVLGLLSIGSQLFQQQRFADAIQLLEVAMDAGLAASELLEGKARALVRMGRYREAEQRLLQLLQHAAEAVVPLGMGWVCGAVIDQICQQGCCLSALKAL